ncbi:MAG: hypothetical protein JJ978_10765 [Roseivirga sp.]|uniref:hypothetical protein n=1 Tax=Roseivirga sp. TaxID=1964215 RepID=UPI001B21DCA3|nr:hypothetical protein [Roseivirga sp.]MBO6496038.1 hypothetical protein [Roseivirga sp.]
MLKSNLAQASFIKYILFVIGSIMVIFSISSFFYPFTQTVDEYTTQPSTYLDSIILLCFGSILVLINTLYYRNVHVIGINIRQFQIIKPRKHEAEPEVFEWSQVEKLYRVKFVTPPLYLIKLKESGRVVIFPTEHSRGKYVSVNTPFGSLIGDISEMGKEIKRIKRVYNI